MLAVLFYRGAFNNFKMTKEIKEIIYEVNKADYIIAPIADNQMYQIFNKFIDNEITDVACYHALCASNLGKQYIFKTNKALKSLKLIDRFYMCKKEKDYYFDLKKAEYDVGISKASIALKEYRRKGKYFDEIFKRL